MATLLGTNALLLYRRHLTDCSRFPGEISRTNHKPQTLKPTNKKQEKADTCVCPIACRGYLKNETKKVNGKTRPKKVECSLGVNDWKEAEDKRDFLYERGTVKSLALAPDPTMATVVDPKNIKVEYAVTTFMESRKPNSASAQSVAQGTHNLFTTFLDLRLKPYCLEKEIDYIHAFESFDQCEQFMMSWRQLRGNVGAFLAMSNKRSTIKHFRTFLAYCVQKEWMGKNGAKLLKFRKESDDPRVKRYGLAPNEYIRLLNAPDGPGLTAVQNREVVAAIDLERFVGMRISDTSKFNDSEIVRNERNTGWNAVFIQQKTKIECTSPISQRVKDKLDALPGYVAYGKKYFFTCGGDPEKGYTCDVLRQRIEDRAARAQREKKFAHHFSPHCLRHTFCIEHLRHGTPVTLVASYMGDTEETIRKYYSNWIKPMIDMSEDVSQEKTKAMENEMNAIALASTEK